MAEWVRQKDAFLESVQSGGGCRAIQDKSAVGRWSSEGVLLQVLWHALGAVKSKGKNMKMFLNKMVVVIVGVAALGVGGCSNIHSEHPTAIQSAVMCDKCKTTWVTRSEPTGRSVYRYTREKAMVCPDCRSAVENWLRTGELKHTCSHCKGKMTCEAPRKD